MVDNLLKDGYKKDSKLNCAELTLSAGNIAYKLGICDDDIKIASAFGGGLGTESVCGIVTGSLMVLGKLFVEEYAHESELMGEIAREYQKRFKEVYGSVICSELKKKYREEENGCRKLIEDASCILSEIIDNYKNQIKKKVL